MGGLVSMLAKAGGNNRGDIVASKRFDDDNDPNTPCEWENKYFFYNYDMRGSTTAIIKPDGNAVTQYAYDEFGNLSQTGTASFKNEVTFTGSISDTSTGLQYMNSRYYDSTTGRFISQDTYTGNPYDPWTQNLYSYCGGNPTNFIDPTGHSFWSVVGDFFDGLVDLGKSIYTGLKNNAKKAFEKPSFSSIANWLTLGAVDAIGNQLTTNGENYKKAQKNPSIKNIINYATSGLVDTAEGVVSPEKPFSKEHWADSFSLAFTVLFWGGATSSAAKTISSTNSIYQTMPAGAFETTGSSIDDIIYSGKQPVIGKMSDLNTPGSIAVNQYKIADLLSDKGTPKLNWKQNSGVLRKIMNQNQPILDVSLYPMNNAGFLCMERGLLLNHNWTYKNGTWIPKN